MMENFADNHLYNKEEEVDNMMDRIQVIMKGVRLNGLFVTI